MRIIIIDDHPFVRRGLISVLSLENNIEIVGEASNVSDACRLVDEKTPDIALIDLRLGVEDGLDIVVICKRKKANCKYIVLTSSGDEWDFKRANDLCVQGYVLKEVLPEELIYAIQLVYKGRKYYDPKIMDQVMNENNQNDPYNNLTDRELEVLILLGEGLSNKDIAAKLYISVFTAKKHVSQILSKLELTDRIQAALYAQTKLCAKQVR